MNNTWICIVVLLISQILWTEAALAAAPVSPKINEEVSKQESIYRSKGEQVPAGYTVNRALSVYTDALSSGFDSALANLGPADRWLDIGAGEGLAILDYFSPAYDLAHAQGRERRGRKAQAVAMSIEDRRTLLWQQTAARLEANQIQYLADKRLRDYSVEELGQFQVITDVIGGFSYAVDLSLFMEKVIGFLKVSGDFFTVLQDVRLEDGSNRPYYANSPFLTEITSADGSEVKVCSWLKKIACVEVTCELRKDWTPPIEAFRIRKTCNDVTVPALLQVGYSAGTPPERRYRLRD